MKPDSDNDLLEVFAHARRCDREDAPAWRPELLNAPGPVRRRSVLRRWIVPALEVACVIVVALLLDDGPRQERPLSEALPPLLESQPGELFASLEPSLLTFEAPSDFLFDSHLNPHIP
ncbi:hypothetical protein [Prosthecobacter sp.]|uniref:hypothetical protein n=1 Tax=Prosthecobacter sp. TaxID=1965333 RepID=UPI003782DDE5